MEKEIQETSIRIAVLGPECSGKSTLCADLNKATGCTVIDEFAREYLEQRKGRAYDHQDLVRIAHVQAKRNRVADDTLVACDTEMTTMAIWSKEKLGGIPPRILELEREQIFDFYFLCYPEMEWEQDPLRENEKDRESLFELYRERLNVLQREFKELRGSREKRLSTVLSILNA